MGNGERELRVVVEVMGEGTSKGEGQCQQDN